MGKAKIQGAEYQNGWEIGERHKLIAGIEWNRAEAESSLDGYSNHKVDNQAIYLQDTFSLTNKWTLIPGIRYDHSEEYGNQWSPKFSTNYRADEKTKLYASWGKVYRTPTIAEIYLVDDDEHWYGNDYVLRHGGEIALKSEKGHTETVGIEHDFDDKTSIAFNLFNIDLDEVIRWTPVSVPYDTGETALTYFPSNAEREKRRGGELTFRQKVNDNWGYDLGYSHTKIDNELSNNSYGQPNGYRIGLHYKNREWKANLLGIMASGLDKTYFASGKYAVLDFNTSYDVNDHATVYFRALNFTNQNYSNIGSNYPSPSRFIQAGVTYKF